MAIRTVRLDEETEKVLQQIRKATGLPISEALKQGLRVFHERVQAQVTKSPYDVYNKLDLGVGGWGLDDSTHVHPGVSRALKKKFNR